MGLKEIRQRKNMPVEELSRKSGISQASISRIERNKQNPRLSVAIALAKALGCTVDELLEQASKAERPGA